MRKNVQEICDKLDEMKLGDMYDNYLATWDQGATEDYFAGIDSMTANDVRAMLDEMMAEEQREEFREIVAQTGLSLEEVKTRVKEFTKNLYEEKREDLSKLRGRYNGKDAKRTPEQIRQSAKDQANKYTDKWNKLLEQCETPAQKEICKDVLYRIRLKLDEGLVVADVKEKEQKQEQEQADEQRKEFRKIVAQTGLSLAKFAERYEIPLRSVENWSGGQRTAPDYVIKLLSRVVAEDFPE